MEVTKSSNASVPEIISLTKLQKYANNGIFVNVVSKIESVTSALWLKEGGYKESEVAPTYVISNRKECHLSAQNNLVITQNINEEVMEFEIMNST